MEMDAISNTILDIINQNIEDADITLDQLDDDLLKYGMDSIKFISIVIALETAFEIEYPDNLLLISQSNTLNKLAGIVFKALEGKNGEGKEKQNEWFTHS